MQVKKGLLNLKKIIYEQQQNINQLVEISEEDAIKYGFINDSGNEPSKPENPDTPITSEEPDEIDYSNEYFTIEFIENGSLGFKFINDPYRNDKLYYSFDKVNWEYLSTDNWQNNIEANTLVYLKSNIIPAVDGGDRHPRGMGTFKCTGKFNISGNIMSLLYGDFFNNQKSLYNKKSAFNLLFNKCENLINSKNLILPATILDDYCYDNMFSDCTSLVTSPKILPAINLTTGCYRNMFFNCSSLLYSPKIMAINIENQCYRMMLNSCNSLQKIYCLSNITSNNYIDCADGMLDGISSSGIFIKQYNVENSILPLHWIIKEIEINDGNETIINEYINE